MRPTELMLNDWVCYNGDTEYTNPVQIEDIGLNDDMCITSDRDDVGFDGIIPIPITVEFLKKNGFVEEDIKEVQDINDIRYVLYGDWGRLIYVPGWKAFYVISPSSSEEWFNICATAKYVHEIQHMLRFAKLNDIADNLKV